MLVDVKSSVNLTGKEAQDILEVANHIQTTVFQTFWVELHPEVVYVS